MTQTKIPKGPFGKARNRLLEFALSNKIKNETLLIPLEADWSSYSTTRAAYVLGAIWGRLRQMNSFLEEDTEYANLVNLELKKHD